MGDRPGDRNWLEDGGPRELASAGDEVKGPGAGDRE